MPKSPPNSAPRGPLHRNWIALVKEKVESLQFGVVLVVVHDGQVIQIERTERTRLPSQREEPTAE